MPLFWVFVSEEHQIPEVLFSICYQWHYQTSDIDKIQDLSCHMVKTKHHEAIPIPTFSKTTMPTLKSKPSTFPDLSRQQTATTFATSNLLAAAAHSSTKPETPAQSFLSSTALPSSSLNVPGMLPSLSLPYPKTLGKLDFNYGTSNLNYLLLESTFFSS